MGMVVFLIMAALLAACGPAVTEEEAPAFTAEAATAQAEEATIQTEETAAAADVEQEAEQSAAEPSDSDSTDSSDSDQVSDDVSPSDSGTGADQNDEESAPPATGSDFDIYDGFSSDEVETMESGLQYIQVTKGDGPAPEVGEVVSVHYTGHLEDGTVFDSSVDRNEPIQFALGRGMVIPGWDEGIALLNVGGKARLIIPPELAYGSAGAGGVIPPDATLVFDVELIDVKPGAPDSPTALDEAEFTETDSGLRYFDLVEGDGPTPEEGQQVIVHYTGWLKEDGVQFDSSLNRGQPIVFTVGIGQVIPGWDEALTSMNVGGKRQVVIPPELAYGEAGAGGGIIPPNATLIFEMELVDVQ